jgi:uncharacterized membrane protein YraQ (UPF0718 family)
VKLRGIVAGRLLTSGTACQTISGAYFNTAAQSVFSNTIYKQMAVTAPHISPSRISKAGASGLRNSFSGQELTHLLEAYMNGIKNVFIFAIAGTSVTVIVALLIPTTRLPAPEKETNDGSDSVNGVIDK